MASFFTFMLFLSYTGLVVQAVSIEIVRETGHPNDDFHLQRGTAECPSTGPKCGKYSAAFLAGCWCHCGKSEVNYTFFEPNNTCVKVAVARRLSGCDSLFTDETVDDLLRFFPSSGIHQKTVNVPANKTCSFYYGGKIYVQYLACDGSWKEIPSQFAIESLAATPGWSTNRLHIRSKPGATFLANNTGRILRMAVQCRSRQDINVAANSSSCVMFKVEGRRDCPVPQQNPSEPSATLPQPSAGTIILITGTLPPVNTPVEKLTGTSSKEFYTNLTSTTVALPPQTSPTEETTGMASQTTSEVSPRPSEGGEKNFLLGVITGLSASMIILLVIIGLLVYRCRNTRAGTANTTGNSTQDTVMENPQTNSDFERDYESVNNSISSEPWELQTYVRMEGVPQHPPVNDAPESDQNYINMQGGQGIRGFGHIYENSRGVL